MVKIILTALVAVTLVAVFSVVVIAQEKTDVKAKPEDMTKTKDMGASGLMSASCDPACGFRVTSHDKAEISAMVKQHAKTHHQKNMTDAEVMAMIQPAGKKGSKDKAQEGEMKAKETQDPHKH